MFTFLVRPIGCLDDPGAGDGFRGRVWRMVRPLHGCIEGKRALIQALRQEFNERFTAEAYAALRRLAEAGSQTEIQFRLAETPVFVPSALLEKMATAGAEMTLALMERAEYLRAAREAIPAGYCVAGETRHPNFLTADFALVETGAGEPEPRALEPRLVELQAFPSLYGFQTVLCEAYRRAFRLPEDLGIFLSGLTEDEYWRLLERTVLGGDAPENVVLAEVDPMHQKTLPDFLVTSRRLGIPVVNIAEIEAEGDRLLYRDGRGRRVPIHRIYNRAIADELIAKGIQLRFDWTQPLDVEWAGHPNWYFLISKFSVPWLAQDGGRWPWVPPSVFLDAFLEGDGRRRLEQAGVALPKAGGGETVYGELILKPLFSFAGKGIVFEPTQALLESIPAAERGGYLLQQRMRFVPTVETPCGPTQAEFRILYLWPDGGELTSALSLVRLGRGKMMGVDHNRNQEWVGASAAFHAKQR